MRTTAKGKAFPWLPLKKGNAQPKETFARKRCASDQPGIYAMVEANALAWLGKSDIELFEQTQVGQSGHALTLLWASLPEEEGDTLLAELDMPKFR